MEYLTLEKKTLLEDELKNLMSVRRKEIADALEYAKSLGDLSENAEYHQAREDQANCEDRITHIEQILKNAVVMDTHAKGVVSVGALLESNRCNFNDLIRFGLQASRLQVKHNECVRQDINRNRLHSGLATTEDEVGDRCKQKEDCEEFHVGRECL